MQERAGPPQPLLGLATCAGAGVGGCWTPADPSEADTSGTLEEQGQNEVGVPRLLLPPRRQRCHGDHRYLATHLRGPGHLLSLLWLGGWTCVQKAPSSRKTHLWRQDRHIIHHPGKSRKPHPCLAGTLVAALSPGIEVVLICRRLSHPTVSSQSPNGSRPDKGGRGDGRGQMSSTKEGRSQHHSLPWISQPSQASLTGGTGSEKGTRGSTLRADRPSLL
ncbi:uncharacterized protein LOC113922445 [Zalophus californianus]|uniref:Uncharacterized protein LOC113922445 n=1 Tax=Zalophus californianus TaxID=9704 RepID=A0A6J2D342_ZALCA|nr:uncharacterized protein LOC113922445 [Zalophus californianus]